MKNVVPSVSTDLTTMLFEAQKQLDRQFNSFTNLRKYAEIIIGVSSVIISLFATFKVFDPAVVKPQLFYFLFLGAAFLYAILMMTSVIVAVPSHIQSPIEADRKNYEVAYADKSEREIIAIQIALYINAIKINEDNLKKRYWLANIIGAYLCAMVIFLLFATMAILIV